MTLVASGSCSCAGLQAQPRWLRQAGAVVLCLFVVGGGLVGAETALARALPSLPAEACFMSALHEIQIDEIAIEPQPSRGSAQPIKDVGRYIELKFKKILRERISLENSIDRKGLAEGVDGRFWQLVSDCETEMHFKWNRLCSSEIEKNQAIDAERIDGWTAGVTPTPTEPFWFSANYRQLNSDGGPCSEIGGIGGSARGLVGSYQEVTLKGRDCYEASGQYSEPQGILGNSFIGGAVNLCGFFAGLLGMSIAFGCLIWWEYRR